jgi:hypothetical protein
MTANTLCGIGPASLNLKNHESHAAPAAQPSCHWMLLMWIHECSSALLAMGAAANFSWSTLAEVAGCLL